jgi:hypothetical protein
VRFPWGSRSLFSKQLQRTIFVDAGAGIFCSSRFTTLPHLLLNNPGTMNSFYQAVVFILMISLGISWCSSVLFTGFREQANCSWQVSKGFKHPLRCFIPFQVFHYDLLDKYCLLLYHEKLPQAHLRISCTVCARDLKIHEEYLGSGAILE